ncbi:MAG: hypothetical protein K2X54_27840 [Methylobacterium organophilum]|nr:hypothetical protein [Methylobacterium organophilum]
MLRLASTVLAAITLACVPALAQVQPSSPPASATYVDARTQALVDTITGSILKSGLYVGSAPAASGNPVPVSVGNFPATQPVTQSGAWSFGLSGPIPAGSNLIGAVTQSGAPWVVSGTVSVGNLPVTQSVSNGGTFPVQNTAALPAGSNTIGSVNVLGGNTAAVKTDSSGVTQPVSAASLPLPSGAATATNQATANTALGAPSDAAYTGTGTPSIVAALKGIYAAAFNPQPITASYFFEASTPLAANASFTGPTRFGAFGSSGGRWSAFQAKFVSSAAGTAYLDVSPDGATWFTAETATVTAGGAVTLRTPTAPAMRVRFVNGATAQTSFYVGALLTAN